MDGCSGLPSGASQEADLDPRYHPPRSYAYFDSLTRLAVVAGRRPASVPGFDPWALFLYELRLHLGSRRVDVQLVNGSCQEVLGMLTEACDEVSMPPYVGE